MLTTHQKEKPHWALPPTLSSPGGIFSSRENPLRRGLQGGARPAWGGAGGRGSELEPAKAPGGTLRSHPARPQGPPGTCKAVGQQYRLMPLATEAGREHASGKRPDPGQGQWPHSEAGRGGWTAAREAGAWGGLRGGDASRLSAGRPHKQLRNLSREAPAASSDAGALSAGGGRGRTPREELEAASAGGSCRFSSWEKPLTAFGERAEGISGSGCRQARRPCGSALPRSPAPAGEVGGLEGVGQSSQRP